MAGDSMPELPEVEVTRRRIAPLLVGRRVSAVHTTASSYFFVTPPARLRRALSGRRIEALARHGKYLLAALDGGQRLLLHLGMTGQLFAASAQSVRLLSSKGGSSLKPEAQPGFRPDVHTHLTLHFEDGGEAVHFRDVRKFGKVQLLTANERCARLDKLGVDALEATGAALFQASRGRRIPVKTLLLDQAVLAGVGNIYADEALFVASVSPRRAAQRLTRDECDRVLAAAQQVMLRSIETGGSSISDYVQPDGSDGRYQDERRAYGRTGEACSRCGTPIKRIVLAQRATHYCPSCQR
jgi:formamidopyrimidine-DNA glycosylase